MKLEEGKKGIGVAGKKVNLRGKGHVFGILMILLVPIVASVGVGISIATETPIPTVTPAATHPPTATPPPIPSDLLNIEGIKTGDLEIQIKRIYVQGEELHLQLNIENTQDRTVYVREPSISISIIDNKGMKYYPVRQDIGVPYEEEYSFDDVVKVVGIIKPIYTYEAGRQVRWGACGASAAFHRDTPITNAKLIVRLRQEGKTCGKAELEPIKEGISTFLKTSGIAPTATPTLTPTPMPGEDPFNYQGEYELDEAKLRGEEKAALPYVMKYANEYKVSPCLIMAVIRQESDFFDYSQDPDKDPDKFDIGYMQVSHIAAIDTYKKYRGNEYTGTDEEWQQDGLDPDTNIKYGTRYLRIQYNRIEDHAAHYEDVYDDFLKSTASAYNAGHTTKDNEEYVEGVITGRGLIEGQRRGYEFFLTIRVPVAGTPAPEEGEEGVPGFEAVFAIAGLLAVAYLRKRRK